MPTEQQNIKSLEPLVGRWKLSGDVSGTIEYRWAEGERFLIQEVDMKYAGRVIRGMEIIGHICKPGKPATPAIWSRFYSFLDGLTLDYIYEIDSDTFRIWFEDKSLNNFMQAVFSQDGQRFEGAWQWPGGGYEFQARKIQK